MRRMTAAALAVCLLVLTGCGSKENGTVKEGRYYEVTGICPDAVLLTVNGRDISADRYFYWLAYNCDWLEQSLGSGLDWSGNREGQTLGDYVKAMTLEHVTLYAVVEEWAEKYQAALTEEDNAAMEAEYQALCEACGGEEAYLQTLAGLGADRELVRACSEAVVLYGHLLELCHTEGSELAPDAGELDDWISENSPLTVEYLTFGSGATADLAEQRRQAEAALTRLKEAGEPQTEFSALAGDGVRRGVLTFLPGESGIGETFEDAAQALEEGQYSQAPVETELGVCLLLRRAVDRKEAAEVQFDQSLRQAAETARVDCGSAYASIDAESFWNGLKALRQADGAAESGAESAGGEAPSEENG